MKIGNFNRMEKFLKNGEMYLSRLKGFREIEQAERADINDGISHSYQPNKVSLIINDQIIEEVNGPIRVDINSENPLVYCMYGFNSDHAQLIDQQLVDDRCRKLGDTCVVIKDRKEFYNRVKRGCKEFNLGVDARLIDYVDYYNYHGEMGVYKKYQQWHAHQHEYRLVFDELTDIKNINIPLGSLEDIAEIFPFKEIHNIIKIQKNA